MFIKYSRPSHRGVILGRQAARMIFLALALGSAALDPAEAVDTLSLQQAPRFAQERSRQPAAREEATSAARVHAVALPNQPRSMMQSESAKQPMLPLDCVPCVRCYAAPGPPAHWVGGNSGEPDTSGWWALPRQSADLGCVFDAEKRPALLPVRIAYCRWRN